MGIRFRRSKNLGPFRVTLGLQGISFSAGIKGLRVTRRADGKTQVSAGIPGSGLYYTEVLKHAAHNGGQEPAAAEELLDGPNPRARGLLPAVPAADDTGWFARVKASIALIVQALTGRRRG